MITYEQLKEQPLYRKVAIECGPGWYHLLNNLALVIQSYLTHKKVPIEAVHVSQIKEKFGSLRFYWGVDDDVEFDRSLQLQICEFVDGAVTMADYMSSNICEKCGDLGRERSGRWIATLCDKHSKPENQ